MLLYFGPMTTTVNVALTIEVGENEKYGAPVSLKIGSAVAVEFWMSPREMNHTYPPSRAALEQFIASEFSTLFTTVAELKAERDSADERRMMYGDDA